VSDELRTRMAQLGIQGEFWPVLVANEPHLLGVHAAGLALVSASEIRQFDWADIAAVDVATSVLTVGLVDFEDVRVYLSAGADPQAIRDAIRQSGGTLGQVASAAIGRAGSKRGRGSAARAGSGSPTVPARERISQLFVGGVALQFVGGAIIGLGWPSTDAEDASSLAVGLGISVAWAGGIMLLIALIAWGVMLGQRAAGNR